ncbi:hypothetical protein CC2G_013223 [Coprinopsis cinerea AmutBmut pab1-1]|nr:hypothetical protein CC2G_013223 [Coprinopsis cinerea AmutBmut pab1-1]
MGHAHPADTAMQVDGDCDDEDCDDEDCDADSEGNCDSADEQDGMDYTDDESATQGNLSESLVGNQLYDYDAPEQYGESNESESDGRRPPVIDMESEDSEWVNFFDSDSSTAPS